uniref:PDZ domain-containing protein n=1 Tax=Timema shepardi TaxID=629360 RepID=A0A7R9G4W8_TIMSH|nr:unnamed protein product [Timema shepardi]
MKVTEGTLRSGDRLIAVNGTSLNEATLTEAQELLNNSECTTTTMTVEYDVNLLECVRSATGPLLVEIERPCDKDLGVTLAATSTGRIIIEGVIAASIAERCGALHVGDQILAVDETRVEGSGLSICEVMELLQSSTVVTLEILPLSQAYYGRRRTNSNARYHGMLGPPSPSPSGYCSLSSQHLNRHNTCLHGGTLPELQEDTTSAPAATVQLVAPDSPDLLELFTKDGICLAEIGCSTGDVAPPSEAKGSSDSVRAQPPEIDDSLRSRATVMAIGAVEGYNYILAELKLLGHLICPPETQDGMQTPLGSQEVVTAELSVLSVCGTLLQHWMLKSPYAIEELSTAARKKADYIVNKLHGIPCDSGDMNYILLESLISSATTRAETVYVKGAEKKKFLAKYTSTPIVDLEPAIIMEALDICTREAKPVKPLTITGIFNTLFPLDEVDAKRVIVGMIVKNTFTHYVQLEKCGVNCAMFNRTGWQELGSYKSVISKFFTNTQPP